MVAANVFLSHASADAAGAKAVAQLLQNAGLDVWLELEKLTPGEPWSSALETALKSSTHFLVLVGETGVQRWVEREVRYALERNTQDPAYRVIPLLGPGAQEAALPLFLRQHQYLKIDWNRPDPTTVQHVAAAILNAPPERVSLLPPGHSPFRGLLTFDTADSLLFFGRDQEVDELLCRLPSTHFLPIVGDSGSGKSSLVRAGLIPALLRRGTEIMDWRFATMKPGGDPFSALAEAALQFDLHLTPAHRLDLIDKSRQHLNREGVNGLSNILAALQLPANSRQLLVIDQFEQLFTLTHSNAEAHRFVDTILHTAQGANSALHLVVTLRADFFGLCFRHRNLWKLLTDHQYPLARMEQDRLRQVIEKPMALAGLPPAPGLVDTMLADVGAQPGGLALLEHALDRLWKECGGSQPAFEHYNKIGRLKGAIQKHADEVLSKKLKSEAQRDMARRIFVELTALGEGTEDSARQVPKAKLLALPGVTAEEVLQILAEERLVTVGDGEDKEAVGIAHEALIREWSQLRTWVDARRRDIRLQRELELAEESFRNSNGDVLRGGRLEDAVRWVQRNRSELPKGIQEFVETSRIRARRQRLVVTGVIVGLASLSGLVLWLWVRAEGLRKESLTRQLAAESIALFPTSPESYIPAALLAIESMQRRPILENHAALRQATAVMVKQVSSLAHKGSVNAVAFSPDGKWVATGSSNGTLTVMEALTGKAVAHLARKGGVNAVAFSPDGKSVATASDDKYAAVMVVSTGKEVASLAHKDTVRAVAFSPDGRWVATGSVDNTARVMEAATGKEVAFLEHQDTVNAVAFSPDGNWVATGSSDGTARVMEAATGKEVAFLVHQDKVNAVAFSPDGKWVATGSSDYTARVMEAATGKEVSRLKHQYSVLAVAFSPDGKWVATGSLDKTARVMEAATGKEVARFAHQERVDSIAFSPNGKWVATGSLDGSSRVMEAATGKEVTRLTHKFGRTAVAFSPDGKWLATESTKTILRVTETATGREMMPLPDEGGVLALAFSPDGKWVATGSLYFTARVMEAATGKVAARLTHQMPVSAVAFSPDGKRVATGSGDMTARVTEAATGKEVARLAHQGSVLTVAFSPNGEWVATGSDDRTARVMVAETGKELVRVAHQELVITVAFSPDGQWLATGSADNSARVMEATTGKVVARLSHQGIVTSVAFSPDGKWVATGSLDKTARVMEVATGKELVRHQMNGWVQAVSFPSNSVLLVAANTSETETELTRLQLDPAELIRDACSRLPRNLTRQEWAHYLPGEPYRKTCPNLAEEPE